MKKFLCLLGGVLVVASCSNDYEPTNLDIGIEGATQLFDSSWQEGEYTVLQLANGQIMYMDRDSTFFLGDIIFSKEQVELMNAPQPKAVVVEPYVQYWQNKTIKYFISPGFTTAEVQYILDGLSILEQEVCLDFVPSLTMSTTPCIVFAYNTEKNASPIGMNSSKRNTIYLSSGGFTRSTVIHEVMHSLGFFHEQSRNDRDNYVIVYRENVEDGHWHNFQKVVDQGLEAMNLSPFDFDSIMIYDSNAFAIEGTLTMTKLDGSYISRKTSLSNYDKAALNFIYGPEPILTTTIIYSDSFNDNNSIDEHIRYSNVITFQDMSGQPVALTYPRLLVVDYYSRTKNGEQSYNDEEFFDLSYYTVPAGATQYVLPDTEYIRQEDLGVNRYFKQESYSVRVY